MLLQSTVCVEQDARNGSGQLLIERGEEDLSVSAKRRKCILESDSDSDDGGRFSSLVRLSTMHA